VDVAERSLLVGRRLELARLAGLVAGIGERGEALLIRGEAGVGKSALVAEASAEAAGRGVGVFRTTGAKSEAHLPFAALHELLLPFLGRLDQLPEVQRHALEMALGLAPRETEADIFLVGLATLSLVGEIATETPLLFVVEDAQWVDRSSGMVFGFVARRLEMEPVLMWFAVRAGVPSDADQAGLPELDLGGLSEEASARLLELHGSGLPADLRRRILDQAAGNPLALIELPVAARRLASEGISPGSDSLPLTATLERAFVARLDDLDPNARALLLVAALEDAEPAELLHAAESVGGASIDVADWQPVVAAGLGVLTPEGFRFRHPLVRSAVEQASTLEERRAAHAALAAVLVDDPERAVWHRADATAGQDEAVASALAATAEQAGARGAGDVAIAAFERSASLTPDRALRALRLWHAGTLTLHRGRSRDGGRLLAEAQRVGLPPFENAAASLALESLAGTMSSGEAMVAAFLDVAETLLAAGEPQKALQALDAIAVRAYWGSLDDETRRRASEVARRIDAPADESSRLCFLAHVDPVRNGRDVLERLEHLSAIGYDGPAALLVGLAAAAVWADDLALPFLRAAGDQFRAEGRLGVLATVLATEAWAHVHRGAALPAITTASESARLASETGMTLYVPAAKLAEAVAVAQRGREAAARAMIAETEGLLFPLEAAPLLALVELARGRVELAAGCYGEAYRRLGRLFDEHDVAFHPFLRGHALADLVDAAKGGDGDLELVQHYLDEWEPIVAHTQASHLRAQMSYARAVLSDNDDAEKLFRIAAATGAAGWQVYGARARLAYGVWLRRIQRRATDARQPLREAAETFNALGQEVYAERALAELRASGETARRRVLEAWTELTPQELHIAQLAAQGLSNKEIGERLYISHRTVGTHLYHLFPKLGITSRAELRDALKPAQLS
jgi:DNA-binding NarL/FixJ family response regulator